MAQVWAYLSPYVLLGAVLGTTALLHMAWCGESSLDLTSELQTWQAVREALLATFIRADNRVICSPNSSLFVEASMSAKISNELVCWVSIFNTPLS